MFQEFNLLGERCGPRIIIIFCTIIDVIVCEHVKVINLIICHMSMLCQCMLSINLFTNCGDLDLNLCISYVVYRPE